ncbi:MAG: hypothetical protein PVH05_14210 [Burkholderiales bacterium]|jgi:hypothetical protein
MNIGIIARRGFNNPSAELANPTPAANSLTGRERQINELYDLFDQVMIERLLKRHPSLDKVKGA